MPWMPPISVTSASPAKLPPTTMPGPMLPPRAPRRSISSVRSPARPQRNAANMPAIPDPATTTSTSAATGTRRWGSTANRWPVVVRTKEAITIMMTRPSSSQYRAWAGRVSYNSLGHVTSMVATTAGPTSRRGYSRLRSSSSCSRASTTGGVSHTCSANLHVDFEAKSLMTFWVFRNSCGRTSHVDRRVEIEAAENAEPGVAADGVPQQDDAGESMATSVAVRFTVPDS